jgi:hypothetical protein
VEFSDWISFNKSVRRSFRSLESSKVRDRAEIWFS